MIHPAESSVDDPWTDMGRLEEPTSPTICARKVHETVPEFCRIKGPGFVADPAAAGATRR
jgi:hypothetical protein